MLLEVENLTKSFNGLTAVDRVSFKADAGEIFGLLGPNGAGKTTTIRLIATLLSPDEGTAVICGHDILKEPEAVRKSIGVLTTEIGVYDRLTGRENLRYFGELYGLYGENLDRRVEEIVETLDMGDFIDRRAGEFSTGMKQKLAIARSIVHDPQVIVFDEPTSGLDVLASQTIMAFMKKAREMGKLVVLSTHQMSDAERLCGRAAIIHKGRILTIDAIANLKEKTGTSHLEDAFLELVEAEPEKVAP